MVGAFHHDLLGLGPPLRFGQRARSDFVEPPAADSRAIVVGHFQGAGVRIALLEQQPVLLAAALEPHQRELAVQLLAGQNEAQSPAFQSVAQKSLILGRGSLRPTA